MNYTHGGNVYKVSREQNIPISKIVDFSANINPFGLSKLGKDRLENSLDGILNYPDPEYIDLKSKISYLHKIKSNNLFLGNGAIDLIFYLIRFLNPQNALILAPTFVEYERSLLSNNCNITYLNLKKENEFKLDTEEYIKSLHKQNFAIICNPNNPTGKLVEKNDILKICEYCNNNNIALLIDEAFMDFVDFNESHSLINKISNYKNIFILRSITKFFAVPGLRIGYLITNNSDFKNYYNTTKEPWCINHFAQEYTLGAIDDKEYIYKTKIYIISQRVEMCNKLNQIKNIKAFNSSANYIFFCYKGNSNLKVILEKQGILIRSCENYHNLDKTYFRIAVKTEELNTMLINKLKEIINLQDV